MKYLPFIIALFSLRLGAETVQDSAAFVSAVYSAAAGDTIMLEAGEYGTVTINRRFAAPTVITAADPAAKPVFTKITLVGVSRLVFEHLAFYADSSLITDTTASAVLVKMIDNSGVPCSTVTFNHCLFTGVITDAGSISLDGYAAHVEAFDGDALGVDRLTVYACEFTRIYSGVALQLRDSYIGFNNFHHIRSDPVRSNMTDVMIENNIFYFPAGRHEEGGAGDHGSVLDIRALSRVVIRNNYCNQGGGVWTNAFALQTNGEADQGYVTVHNNIIYDGNSKCLAIRGLPHSVVSNNLVLFNHYDIKKTPAIKVTGVTAESVTVINNIAPAYAVDDTLLNGFGLVMENNLRVQRDDPAAAWYYGDLFEGAMDDSAAVFESFHLLPGALDTFTVRPGVDYTAFTQIALWAAADTTDSATTGIMLPDDGVTRLIMDALPDGWYRLDGRRFRSGAAESNLPAGMYLIKNERGLHKAVVK